VRLNGTLKFFQNEKIMRKLTVFVSILAFGLWGVERVVVGEEKPATDKPVVEISAAEKPTAEKQEVDKPVIVDLMVGAAAPAFKGVDERGQPWDSAEYLGKKYIVVYFYPADFTGGCITQAEKFRDTMNQLTDRGIMVIGVSGDSVRNHKFFKPAWKLNYTLLADEPAEIAAQFGVPVTAGGIVMPFSSDRKPVLDEEGKRFRLERKATFGRWTFIIGKDGKILYKNTKVIPAEDAKKVLDFIANLEQPQPEAAAESSKSGK
jgi:peroxiredoxin Q/BCP